MYGLLRTSLLGCTLVFAGLLTACEEGPPPADPITIPSPTGPLAPERPVCDPDADLDPGLALPRRLSRIEYTNTVRDLLGFEVSEGVDFPPDEEMLGFDNNARALQLTALHAEGYMASAEDLSARAVASMDAWLPCDVDGLDLGGPAAQRACAEQVVWQFGRRAWRRPVTETEFDRLMALYDVGAEIEGRAFDNGLGLVIEAMLQSPNFLFRVEIGTPDPDQPGLNRLDDYEVASRLSYLLWRSMPDDILSAAADAGELRTADQIVEQARRMLADERSQEALWSFFAQWLHLDEVDSLVRDARYYAGFGDAERRYMANEARAFVEQAVWGGDLRQLFAGAFQHPDDPAHLGPRIGVLAQPAILAVTSSPVMTSPVHRGVFVREQILCDALPPPPADLAVVAPNPDPNQTTRQIFAEHSAEPACKGCHQLIDPLGFGFEHFDAIGQWREVQNGFPVDAEGEVLATLDIDGSFYGLTELSERLARSEQTHRCVATQLFRFAYGRGEQPEDACALDSLYDVYVAAGYDFRGMIDALVSDPAFRHRRGVQ